MILDIARMPEEAPEAPEASCLCAAQGNIQARIKPAMWIPLIRSLHLYEETWSIAANPVVCSQDVLHAVSQLRTRSLRGNVFTVGFVQESAENSRLEIVVYTKMRYVFVIRLKFIADSASGRTVGHARSFASGVMPAWFPLGFFFSSLFFFLPFHDCGFSALWLRMLRKSMTIPVEVQSAGRKI